MKHNQPNVPDPTLLPSHRRAMLAGIGGLAAGAFLTGRSHAGPLDPPPGPIDSTGKTLTEVEPRIAINQTNTPGDAEGVFVISQPGSYYFTSDVTGVSGRSGIVIRTSNVAIDLNGFSLIGVPGAFGGIRVVPGGPRENYTIRNGSVIGWPLTGVNLLSGQPNNTGSLIENLYTAANGGSSGISANSNAVIRDCVSSNNTGLGIQCSSNCHISNCIARGNAFSGIACTSGIIDACVAAFNGQTGIALNSSGSVIRCVSEQNGLHGISTASDTLILENLCFGNGTGASGTAGAGIQLFNQRCRVEGNSVIGNGRGVIVSGPRNYLVRNICSGNTLNWSVAANNVCLVVNSALGPAFSGNAGGSGPSSTNPYANFTL